MPITTHGDTAHPTQVTAGALAGASQDSASDSRTALGGLQCPACAYPPAPSAALGGLQCHPLSAAAQRRMAGPPSGLRPEQEPACACEAAVAARALLVFCPLCPVAGSTHNLGGRAAGRRPPAGGSGRHGSAGRGIDARRCLCACALPLCKTCSVRARARAAACVGQQFLNMVKKLQKKDGLEVLRDDSPVPEPSVGTLPRDDERFGSIRMDLFSRRKSPANCVDWLRKGRGVRCTEDADL